MTKVVKSEISYQRFLDRILPQLELWHARKGNERFLAIIRKSKSKRFFFFDRETETIEFLAKIHTYPGFPSVDSTLRLQILLDSNDVLTTVRKFADLFEEEFGIEPEIIF